MPIFFRNVSEGTIKKSLEELDRLYKVTQEWLKDQATCERYNINNGQIRLYRGLRNKEDIVRLYHSYQKAKNKKIKRFVIYTNIFISFSFSNGWSYVDHYLPVSIRSAIDTKNILLVGNLIEDMEYGEWIVVNTHPMGELELSVDDVIYAKGENVFCAETLEGYYKRIKAEYKIDENIYKPLYLDIEKYPPHKLGRMVKVAFRLEQRLEKIKNFLTSFPRILHP